RGLRLVRSSLHRTSLFTAFAYAGGLGGVPTAQGLSRGGLSLAMAHLTQMPALEPVEDRTMILNMGPQHPSTHGVLRLILEIDGETVVRMMPDIGYLHTGIEKTCEAKFYQQVVPLTDRIDYLCPLTNNLCYCLALEPPIGFFERARDFANRFPSKVDEYENLLTGNPIWMMRTKGVAKITAEDALALGASGPTLRGSGVDFDLRRDMPYSSYERF